MSDTQLPPLHPARQGGTGSLDPQLTHFSHHKARDNRGRRSYLRDKVSINFTTKNPSTYPGSRNRFQFIHQKWNQEVMEIIRRSRRLKAELRDLQEQAKFLMSQMCDGERKICTPEEENKKNVWRVRSEQMRCPRMRGYAKRDLFLFAKNKCASTDSLALSSREMVSHSVLLLYMKRTDERELISCIKKLINMNARRLNDLRA